MGSYIHKIRQSGEITSIYLLRGLAASMVCFFHFTRGIPDYLPASSLLRMAGSWGWSGVEIFFVISGFIIPYSMYVYRYRSTDILLFLKKRTIRIEFPYLVSIILTLLLMYLNSLSPSYQGPSFHIDYGNLAGHLIYLNAFTQQPWINPIYWTLALEIQFYLLMGLTYILVTSSKRLYRLMFFIAFAASSFLTLPQDSYVFNFSPFFLAGILLFQFFCGFISAKECGILLGLTLLLILRTWVWPLSILIALTLTVILYVEKIPRFFRYLGSISYSLYLIQGPVGMPIIELARRRITNTQGRECMVIVAYLICLFAAHLFYRLIERPFKELAGKVSYDRPSRNHFRYRSKASTK